MSSNFDILCFSWNAGGLRLCETTLQSEADKPQTGFGAFFSPKEKCLASNFITDIEDIITQRNPSIVVIVTEEEAADYSFFHARALPSSLSKIKYSLVQREQNYQISKHKLEHIVTGTPYDTALRMSIYARNDAIGDLTIHEMDSDEITIFARRSGALCAYIEHPIYGNFAFVAVALGAGNNPNLNNHTFRSMVKSINNLSLISIMKKFILDIDPSYPLHHIFMMGDFNYSTIAPNEGNSYDLIDYLTTSSDSNINKLSTLRNYDELTLALNDSINTPILSGFIEGVDGNGPLFMPSWKLRRERNKSCEEDLQSCFNYYEPDEQDFGWHDRILYKNLQPDHTITCIEYNSIDVKSMHRSDHASIIGLFSIQ